MLCLSKRSFIYSYNTIENELIFLDQCILRLAKKQKKLYTFQPVRIPKLLGQGCPTK